MLFRSEDDIERSTENATLFARMIATALKREKLMPFDRGAVARMIEHSSRATGDAKKQTWHFPSRAECMVCHSRAARYVLGPTLVQMNKEHDYGGVTGHQMAVLDWLGAIKLNDGDRRAAKQETLKDAGLSDKEVAEELKKYDEIGRAHV